MRDKKRYDALRKREEYSRIKSEIFKFLGDKCKDCGYDKDVRALCIDHVNGGGSEERRKHKGSYYNIIHDRIMSGSIEYQLLCAICNMIKKIEKNEGRKRIY